MKQNLRFVFFLLLVFLLGCQKGNESIVIGNFGALTGGEATFGISTLNGINLAVEEWNENGGILGRKIEIKHYDNQGISSEAELAAEKLINIEKVTAIIGESASSRSIVAARIAEKYGVPLISPTSTSPALTKVGPHIFRVCFIDPFQGEVMAKFAVNTLKLRTAAILRDNKSDYSMGLADFFKKYFESLGGKVVVDEVFASGDVEYKSQLAKIKNQNAEFIFVPGYYTDVGIIAKQARQLGIKAPLLGGDGWDSEELTNIAGTAMEGSYFSTHYTPENPKEDVQQFVKKYQKKFETEPDSHAASGYDAARILFDAIKRAGSTDAEDIRKALASTSNFPGVTGKITINENRDAVKSAVVLKIQGDEFKYVETISP